MGIGNLNNNNSFGRLTANNVSNNKNISSNKSKSEVLKTNNEINTDLLSSATLGDKEGQSFDSNNLDRTTKAAKTKKSSSWISKFKRYSEKYRNERLGKHWVTERTGNDPYRDETCAMSVLYGAARATWDSIFG